MNQKRTSPKLISFALAFFCIFLLATSSVSSETDIPAFFVPPPPFSEDIFPCSECHEDIEPNPERRVLEEHTEIAEGFNHAKEQRWCLDCHNANDRDKLRLVNNKLISFEESYFLCGQCHGTIFRDWKAGVHGKRTGEWNGKKTYRLCVHLITRTILVSNR